MANIEMDLIIGFGVVLFYIWHTKRAIMAAIDDLKAANAAEAKTLAILAKAQQDEVQYFKDLVEKLQSGEEVDIEQVATDMNDRVGNMQTIADALTAASQTQAPADGSAAAV